MNHLIMLFNVPHYNPWKIWIPFYFFFTGLSAGSFLVSTLATVFGLKKFKVLALPAAISAFLLLILAPISLTMDLAQHFRFWHVLVPSYFNPTSPISYGVWLLSVYPMADLVYAYFIWKQDTRMMKILGLITIPLALSVHAYTGFVFGVVKAHAFWNTSIMPFYFLVSATVSGIALLILIYLIQSRLQRKRSGSTYDRDLLSSLTNMCVAFLGLDLFLDLSQWLVLALGSADAHLTLLTIMHDPIYVIGEILLGIVTPLLILSFPKTRGNLGWVTVASILMIVGVFFMRYSLVNVGWDVPIS